MQSKLDFFPERYQQWIFEALKLTKGDEVSPSVLESIRKLNQCWVHQRNSLAQDYYLDTNLMTAYTLYYMTIQMQKLWFMLVRHPAVLSMNSKPDKSILIRDFGCGPGTFIWAILFYLRSKQPETLQRVKTITGIDQSPVSIRIANRLSQSLPVLYPEFRHIKFQFIKGDWHDHLAEPCEWSIFGNTIIENDDRNLDWLKTIKSDVIIVVEPGNRESFQQILPIRDELIDLGWRVLFPCIKSEKCPMGDDNWCHFQINRFSIPLIQRMSAKAGRVNPRHHFIGFIFVSNNVEHDSNHWRVLSKLRRANRSGIRYICDGVKMQEVVLNRRMKTRGNEVFLKAESGDVIKIEAIDRDRFVNSGHIVGGDHVSCDNLESTDPRQ